MLGEIGVDEPLVIAAGDEADFLRVGLFRQCQTVLAGEFADIRLAQVAEREQRAAELLLLGKAEEKVRLILAMVGRALQEPAASRLVVRHPRVVTGSDAVSPNLTRDCD